MRNAFACLVLSLAVAGCADEGGFIGSWSIERVESAHWVAPGTEPDQSIAAAYVGKTIAFGQERIDGPALLACENPKYRFEEVPAEGLFQGNLAGANDDAAAAEAAAAKMGFSPPVRTMTTSCAHDIAFHMSDASHAAFALDNMIFWMVRAP